MCSHTKNTPHIFIKGCIFMFLDNLTGTELVTLANILAIYLSDGLSADQTATLGDFFSALGTNITLISDTK